MWIALFAAGVTASAPASAFDCAKASSKAERRICHEPALKHADGILNATYSKVLALAGGAVRTTLVAQQRDWLRHRDAQCATASTACSSAYAERQDQLTALFATGNAYDDGTGKPSLPSAVPVIVRGIWRVTGVKDPTGRPLPKDYVSQLASVDLPPPGATIKAAPGKLCLNSSCEPFGWVPIDLADTDFGPGAGKALGVPSPVLAFQGTSGRKWSTLNIVKKSDRVIYALLGLCEANASDCQLA